ncbi:RNA-binding S4 domain-containing protein [Bombilactobacillus thymidiniphilus]|uniref:RQC P-site tRNA stabilizing factor n=1 Tax=Bombilactobacillus thymidiniphilus TaxID=2923363 RepID=A0ABY4PET7_9LACO|nr:RNA-binding S4 domain-containing protein [Bombilactobacillus thymidiniphilus]UQS84024.1 RNA-binding S4 domain-containing protein [Bombilactobacillus thymidiniphilus]
MRLDKYLKLSRLVKRRTLAKEIADKGRIEINQRVAKSSTDVQPGDQITIHYGNRDVQVEVVSTPEIVKKVDAEQMYRFIN